MLSCAWLSVTPWTASRQASVSITYSWSLLKLMSIKLVMPSSLLECNCFTTVEYVGSLVEACKLLVEVEVRYSLTRDRTRVPYIGNAVLATGPPGKPFPCLSNYTNMSRRQSRASSSRQLSQFIPSHAQFSLLWVPLLLWLWIDVVAVITWGTSTTWGTNSQIE